MEFDDLKAVLAVKWYGQVSSCFNLDSYGFSKTTSIG